MNGRAARLIRKFCNWAKVKTHSEVRKRKKAWKALSHKERGRRRAMINRVMADPKAAGRLSQDTLG